MQYALMFHTEGPVVDRLPPAEAAAWFSEMAAWGQELQKAGVFVASLRLAANDATTCVRQHGAQVLVTDGPFADTKEFLGGFAMIEVSDREAAIAWARRCPIAKVGTVEVRPQFQAPAA